MHDLQNKRNPAVNHSSSTFSRGLVTLFTIEILSTGQVSHISQRIAIDFESMIRSPLGIDNLEAFRD